MTPEEIKAVAESCIRAGFDEVHGPDKRPTFFVNRKWFAPKRARDSLQAVADWMEEALRRVSAAASTTKIDNGGVVQLPDGSAYRLTIEGPSVSIAQVKPGNGSMAPRRVETCNATKDECNADG